MQATTADIENLLKVQALDMQIAKLQKSVDELPQKQEILDLRHKVKELAAKSETLAKLEKDTNAKLNAAVMEDTRLEEKSAEAQRLIDAASGDYRSVTIHSKELSGYSKRRESLEGEIEEYRNKLAQIHDMESQISQANEQLGAREAKLIEAYKAEGGALISEIAKLRPLRDKLVEQVDAQILSTFERIAKSKNGVAMCALSENSCSVCRASFDNSRVLRLRSQAPLATCPSCGRLMVVEHKYLG